jgi:chromosome partitioning protein
VLRDSQAYVRSAESGIGIHEMRGSLLRDDLETWKPLTDWLEQRSFSLVATEEPEVQITQQEPVAEAIPVPA